MAHAQRDRLDPGDRHQGVGDAGVGQTEAVAAQVVEVETALRGGAVALVGPGHHRVRGDDGGVLTHPAREALRRGALLRLDEPGMETVTGSEGLVGQVHLHPLAGRQELLLPARLHGEPTALRVLLAAVVGPRGADLRVCLAEGHPHAVAGARVDGHPVAGHVEEVGVAPQAHADAAHLPPPGARRDDDGVLAVGIVQHQPGMPADPQGNRLLAEVGVAQHHGEAGAAVGQAHLPLHGDAGGLRQTDDLPPLLQRPRSRGAGHDALVPGAVAALEAMGDPVDAEGEVAQAGTGGTGPGGGVLDAAAAVQVLDDGGSLPGGEGYPGALVLQDPALGGAGAVAAQEAGSGQGREQPGRARAGRGRSAAPPAGGARGPPHGPGRARAQAVEPTLTDRSRAAELAVTTPAAIDGPCSPAERRIHGSLRHAHSRHSIGGPRRPRGQR